MIKKKGGREGEWEEEREGEWEEEREGEWEEENMQTCTVYTAVYMYIKIAICYQVF